MLIKKIKRADTELKVKSKKKKMIVNVKLLNVIKYKIVTKLT